MMLVCSISINFYVLWRGSICPGMPCSPQPGVELFGAVALRGDGEGRIQASDTTLEGLKHWGNTGETVEEPQEEPQETAFESTLALESLEPPWKFESLQSHCLWTQGQDCALGSNISIRAPVEKESVFWSVLAADLSQVHHQRGITGQNRKQIVGKTTPKMLMIYDIVTLVYQIYDDLWISMNIYEWYNIYIYIYIYINLWISMMIWGFDRKFEIPTEPLESELLQAPWFRSKALTSSSVKATTSQHWIFGGIKH